MTRAARRGRRARRGELRRVRARLGAAPLGSGVERSARARRRLGAAPSKGASRRIRAPRRHGAASLGAARRGAKPARAATAGRGSVGGRVATRAGSATSRRGFVGGGAAWSEARERGDGWARLRRRARRDACGLGAASSAGARRGYVDPRGDHAGRGACLRLDRWTAAAVHGTATRRVRGSGAVSGRARTRPRRAGWDPSASASSGSARARDRRGRRGISRSSTRCPARCPPATRRARGTAGCGSGR